MKILALDLGTTMGWATDIHGSFDTGVNVFDVKRGESPGMRYLRFNGWLAQFAPDGWRPDLIVYEQTHNRGGAATEVAAGFATRVQEFCARQRIEHAAVHSATLKKFATGKGNADKPAMVAAVARRWKAVIDDNEADAIALFHYALAELIPLRT
jgi:Holliday junction resolvasome RuvABC endonuclease subunit